MVGVNVGASMPYNVDGNGSDVQVPRILVSGSRSLDARWHESRGWEVTATQRFNCEQARLSFIAALEDAIAEFAVTDAGLRSVCVVHGAAAHGADHWADEVLYGLWRAGRFRRDVLHVERHPARWRPQRGAFRRSAGIERNARMVTSMDRQVLHRVIVCWDGVSSGTRHLLDSAEIAGLKVQRTWR